MNPLFEGLADIFVETFGEPDEIVYTPLGGAPLTLPPGSAIFVDEPVRVVVEGGVSVDDTRKELHLRASDIAAPAEGDTAVVRGITYKVVPPIAPDGKGMIAVTLSKA